MQTSIKDAVINLFKARLTRERYVEHAQSFASMEHYTEEQIALNDLMASVEQQLNDLPDKTRQIFRLNRLEYKTAKEILAQLDIPERTVEYHISLALKMLRPMLQDYFLLAVFFWCWINWFIVRVLYFPFRYFSFFATRLLLVHRTILNLHTPIR